MKTYQVTIVGVSPLLQHRFSADTESKLKEASKRVAGREDYSEEWRQGIYADEDGRVYQPAIHLEKSMEKAALNFKITGKRGKTYKDLFKSAVFVRPDYIYYDNLVVPDELTRDQGAKLYLDERPVRVQRARVMRQRPALKAGWELKFEIEVLEDQLAQQVILEILQYAGQYVGIGDNRPRNGRFIVTLFEEAKEV